MLQLNRRQLVTQGAINIFQVIKIHTCPLEPRWSKTYPGEAGGIHAPHLEEQDDSTVPLASGDSPYISENRNDLGLDLSLLCKNYCHCLES